MPRGYLTPPNQLTRMLARQVRSMIEVMKISAAGRIAMKAMETPASVPSRAARGVLRWMTGARKEPPIRIKPCGRAPPPKPSPGRRSGQGRQHDHEDHDEHVRDRRRRRRRALPSSQAAGPSRRNRCCRGTASAPLRAGCARRSVVRKPTTYLSRPVITRRLTSTLVPRPKRAFQSRGVESFPVVLSMSSLSCRKLPGAASGRRVVSGCLFTGSYGVGEARGVAHPAEDPALGLDHLETHAVEFGKIRGAGVGKGHPCRCPRGWWCAGTPRW